jgi:hypothetical protein
MRGFPKHIHTKEDLEVLATMPEFAAEYKAALQSLLDSRFVWEKKADVAAKDVSKIVETADLRLVTSEVDGKPAYFTMQRVEDPTAKFFKLGLNVGDVEKPIDGELVMELKE